MADEQLNRRLAEVENEGKQIYGDAWQSGIRRIGQAFGPIDENVMRQAVADPNAPANIFRAGQDARLKLLQQAQDCRDGNPVLARELEQEYADIRAREREQHHKMRGR
jgi:hypothetical protein